MEFLRVGISSVVTDKSLDLSNPHGNLPRTKNYAKDTKRLAKTPLISIKLYAPLRVGPHLKSFISGNFSPRLQIIATPSLLIFLTRKIQKFRPAP
jgi:hypothetical protein